MIKKLLPLFLLTASVSGQAWYEENMGYTLHAPGFYNSSDVKSPTYYHPFVNEWHNYPGHAQKLADALAQKSRKFGAGMVRLQVFMTHLQPAPDDYRYLDYYYEIIEAFNRQGIGVILQIDSPPAFMSAIATDSFTTGFAPSSEDPSSITTPSANTDLALYDEIWDRIIAPARDLNTTYKSSGEIRVIISGRNEPEGNYAPMGHPLSIDLSGGDSEWERMTDRFIYHDNADNSNRDLIIGSIEFLGTSGANPIDAYTTHDYNGTGFGSSTGVINIITETGDWHVYSNADCMMKYWAIQRSYGQTWQEYVAHIVEDLDMGGRDSRGNNGKLWSDTQPGNSTELNLDSWNETLSGGVGSTISALKNAHSWLDNRASSTVLQDSHALVITNNAVPFFLHGDHPDDSGSESGHFGYELPSSNTLSYDIYVRNIGSTSLSVSMSAVHNMNSLSFSTSSFTLATDSTQKVTVTFDASNTPEEGFHVAEILAEAGDYYDRIPIVVLSDIDVNTTLNDELIGDGDISYQSSKSTADITSYQTGSTESVYRAEPGKAFSLSQLEFFFGGETNSEENYNASVIVEVWDEKNHDWNPRPATLFRVDGNMQFEDEYAATRTGGGTGHTYSRIVWPIGFLGNPVIYHMLGTDDSTPVTGVRVRMLSLDDGSTYGTSSYPETWLKTIDFEAFGKLYHWTNHRAVDESFGAAVPDWNDPSSVYSVSSGKYVTSNTYGELYSYYTDGNATEGIVEVDIDLTDTNAAIAAGIRFLSPTVTSNISTGLTVRLGQKSANVVEISLIEEGSTLDSVDVTGDLSSNVYNLKVEFIESSGTVNIYWDGASTPDMTETSSILGDEKGFFGLYAKSGVAIFDNFVFSHRPQTTASSEGNFYAIDTDIDFVGSDGCILTVDYYSSGSPVSIEYPWYNGAVSSYFKNYSSGYNKWGFEIPSSVIAYFQSIADSGKVDMGIKAIDEYGQESHTVYSFQ